MPKYITILFISLVMLAGCQPETEESTIIVSLISDGREAYIWIHHQRNRRRISR